MKRGSAAVNRTSLYYEVQGSGAPALVLISGGGTLDRRMWDGQWDAFAEHSTVVRYDVRGIGESTRPDGPFSHSEDLHSLLKFLDAGPAIIVGLSFAAGIAIDLSLEYPDAVKGLVLAAPGLSSDKAQNLEASLAAADLARKEGLASVIDMIVSHPTVLSSGSASAREHVRTIYLDNADVFASDFALVRLWQPTDPPAEQRLSSICAPTLILVGDQDSAAVRATAEKLVAHIQGSELTIVPGAGHLLNLDAPDAFNRAVRDFVVRSR